MTCQGMNPQQPTTIPALSNNSHVIDLLQNNRFPVRRSNTAEQDTDTLLDHVILLSSKAKISKKTLNEINQH
jgi:hypothetical protein